MNDRKDPPGVRPSSARTWLYWLDQDAKDTYEVDRVVGRMIAEEYPIVPRLAVASRYFHERVVEHMARSGLRQILDIGVGMPLPGRNTHELAQAVAPACRVVYVDHDDVILAHQQALTGNTTPEGETAYVHADARDTAAVLDAVSEILDPDEPIGLTMMSMLGHIAEANELVCSYVEWLPPGSWLALCDTRRSPEVDEMNRKYADAEADPYVARELDEIRAPVDAMGLELLGNGFVPVSLWHPDPGQDVADATLNSELPQWGFVARKR
ncbi:SAM-dependent methyltransferase [Streptomyces sp. B6B3]|uniref:SAM-dependent methyltransferase n=1 Tax=Streptomyces sp. B6B3 TaxID=3153570 RepID=UPI00325EEA40